MLVLSRSEHQKIVFPSLEIIIEVLRIRGRVASLGIQAPTEIPIQRAEIAGLKSIDFPPDEESLSDRLRTQTHVVRQRLETATEQLNSLHQMLEKMRLGKKAQQAVLAIFHELNDLDREMRENWQTEDADPDHGPSVLIVEPNSNERELLAGALRISGFQVAAAYDGADARNYLSLHARPDFVLLEMEMPGLGGPELMKHIHQNPDLQAVKLYMMSEHDPQSRGVVIGPEGIAGWFEKPVSPESIVAVFRPPHSACARRRRSSSAAC